ncbi:F-box/kelch-repeat protein At3g06240-like [Rosa rugosa]|uniref:F-box/kelch-repeat protein At3g06240-like n=1 Tax=Rosa rugosa TaxID=74645 RepID=UPI002B4051EE|nr:F-box/kelch-repeat protein At3g06240-like [Rosa rugosa]
MTNKKKIKRVVKLPEDIIVEILLKLPFKYLIQCSCVSKKWRSLILFDPQFSKPHYKVASEQRSLGQSLLCVSRRSKFPLKWFEIPVYTSDPKFQSLEVLAGDHVPNSFLSFPLKEKKYGSLQLLGSCNGLVCLGELSAYERHYKNVCIWNPSTGFIRELPEWERKPQSLLDGVIAFASSGFGYVSATDDYKYVALANDIDCSDPQTLSRGPRLTSSR